MSGSPERAPEAAAAAPPEAPPPEALPPAFPAMWRALRLGYQHQPGLLLAAFGLTLLAALPDALIAFWLALLGKGALARDRTEIAVAALGLALSATGTWFLRVVSTRVLRRFRDRVTVALEAHVARLQATIATISHQERPELLDRLAMLRHQVFVLDHMYMSLFTTCGWVLRIGVTIALLMAIHPAMALLGLCTLPIVATSLWRPGVERAVEERHAPSLRLGMHYFTSATTASAAKELRLAGIAGRWVERRRATWERWFAPVAASRWSSARWHALAWAFFGGAYAVAVALVATRPRLGAGVPFLGTPSGSQPGVPFLGTPSGSQPGVPFLGAPSGSQPGVPFLGAAPGASASGAGALLLAIAAGARLSAYIGGTMSELAFLRGFWLEGSRRLAWLEDYATAVARRAERPAPARLHEGIRLDHVSFAYPGTERLVLRDVDLLLPAGKVVALVGENGAGKSTLVKLLCKLYEPTAGRILLDDEPLAAVRTESWRGRLAGAFQDFFKFELTATQAIGLGDLPRLDDDRAVRDAVARGGADDVVARLPSGLATQLGPTWPGGVELSHGQWQKLALARGLMRERPLLLVLDEPTAALDAETEHALFERFAAATRERGDTITLLVSHRFSTVRMADLIVVLEGNRVAQVGTHEELLAAGGAYAEAYGIQAAAYR